MKQENSQGSQVAPGTLEVIRTFLNTWRIPNDTRDAVDELEDLSAMQQFYASWFGNADKVDKASEVFIVPEEVRQLRADLRSVLETSDGEVLGAWLLRQPVEVTLAPDAQGMSALGYRPAKSGGCRLCAAVMALVVEAIA